MGFRERLLPPGVALFSLDLGVGCFEGALYCCSQARQGALVFNSQTSQYRWEIRRLTRPRVQPLVQPDPTAATAGLRHTAARDGLSGYFNPSGRRWEYCHPIQSRAGHPQLPTCWRDALRNGTVERVP